MMFSVEITVKYAPSANTPTVKKAKISHFDQSVLSAWSGREAAPARRAGGCGDQNPSVERLETAWLRSIATCGIISLIAEMTKD